MSRFQNTPGIYTPLAEKGEIRLLRLIVDLRSDSQHRGTSPLVCELQTTKIAKPSPFPAYTALSYTWGPQNPERYVEINGSKLKVTPNLDIALRHIQKEWLNSLAVDLDSSSPHAEESVVKSGWFWIDAICINQSDNSEKNTQVPQMKEIYECSEVVLVWLGESDPEMDILTKLLGPIGKEAAEIGVLNIEYGEMLAWPKFQNPNRAKVLKLVKEKLDGLIRRVTRGDLGNGSFPLAAFIRLTRREWFARVWVLQELAVARRVIFVCGDMRVNEDEFTAAMVFCSLWIIDQIHCLAAVFLFGWRWGIIKELWNWWKKNGWEFFRVFYAKVSPDERPFHTLQIRKDYQNKKEILSLDRLLVRCFSQGCQGQRIGATDRRDRIYALFNLSSDKTGTIVKCDYDNDCAVTYINAAKAMLENGHVDILSLCRHTQEQGIEAYPSEEPRDLPSWVPNWTRLVPKPWCGRKEDGFFQTNIRDPVNVSFNESNKRILCLEGRRVGMVSEISKIEWDGKLFPEWDLASAHKMVLEVEAFVQKSMEYSPTEKIDAMWRIPICDKECNSTGRLQRATDALFHAYSNFKDVMSQSPKTPTVHNDQPYSPYLTMMAYVYGSRAFISDNGFVGLCPADTIAGDAICAPSGAHAPYVLRQNKWNRYELIGEAFVYGIMDGIDGKVSSTAESFEIE